MHCLLQLMMNHSLASVLHQLRSNGILVIVIHKVVAFVFPAVAGLPEDCDNISWRHIPAHHQLWSVEAATEDRLLHVDMVGEEGVSPIVELDLTLGQDPRDMEIINPEIWRL